MLLPDALVERLQRRRLGRLLQVAAACALSLGAALWAVDASRERTLQRVREESLSLAPAAGPATALLEQLAALDRERLALAELGRGRSDPLFVLTALTERLPGEAVVLSFRGQGEEWQIEGTAADAAAIVPLLDADPRFRDVRFLSASARFREGERTYETFSIAFNVVPDA
jgi:hypothetical protein